MNKPLIAIADDEPEVLNALIEALSSEGYDVLTCADGTALRALIESRKSDIDLVITDINMPGVSGKQILNQVVLGKLSTKVILMTGFLVENDARDLIDAGCYGFLAKPVMNDELLSLVKNTLSPVGSDETAADEYAALSIDHFLTGQQTISSIYLRFSDGRFVKLAHAGAKIDLERLHRFKERGLRELWISKSDLARYGSLVSKLVQAVKPDSASPDTRNRVLHLANELAIENLRVLGVNAETVHAATGAFRLTLENFSKRPETIKLLTLLENADPTIYGHMACCGALAASLVLVLGWTAPKTIETLTTAAFLHDIGLFTLPRELQTLTIPLADQPEKKAAYQTHPRASYEMLIELGPEYADIALTVLDHHEDGSTAAYPRQLSRSEIYPMARNLILIDAFSEGWIRLSDVGRKKPGAAFELVRSIQKMPVDPAAIAAFDILLGSASLADAQKKARMVASRR